MKTSRLVTAIAITAIGALALGACASGGGGDQDNGDKNEKDKVTIAYVPKLIGDPYFEIVNEGGKEAAKDLGNIEWLFQGPNTADAAGQADSVRSFIQQGVDVIAISPVDPNSMAPLIKEARAAGIKVLTADTDAPGSERQVFVNQATAEGVGKQVIDSLANAMGKTGEFAILSCGETDKNLNSWIDAEKKYVASTYPDMKLVDVRYSGGDQAKSKQMASDLINANPNLTGIIGQCVPTSIAVAQAVRDANKIGKVFTVGVGLPSLMAPYLADGSSSAAVLWDPEQLGYLIAWAGLQLAEGKEFAADNKVSDKLSDVKYDAANKMLIMGPALEITKENVGDYKF